ncbi:uncharacterized protein UTRI_05978 [Ustilago trichophora]|uniref:Tyrosinase copper-binding domain-containing protein n=1 Tax=Ustilago trichophora TaxID=86804 RepID=A0A5C3ELN8_9BASI|nr:uncharacterized protein UTRI_05978 [Ustilago trichophora]
MKLSSSSSFALGNFATLTTTLTLAFTFTLLLTTTNITPALAHDHIKRHPHKLSSSRAKTGHLLHCLGKGPIAHADRAKIQALIEANPTAPADENVWLQLGPREWGFKGHDAANADTWMPVDGAAQTGKDRVAKQHAKLSKCVKQLYVDIGNTAQSQSQSGGAPAPPGTPASPVVPSADKRDMGEDRRVLPEMFGGSGFKQVKQGSNDFPLRNPVIAKNDGESVAAHPDVGAADFQEDAAPGQDVPPKKDTQNGAPAPAPAPGTTTSDGVDTKPGPGGVGTVLAGDEKQATPQTPVDQKPGPGVTSPAPAGDDQQPNPDGVTTPAGDGKKLPPGIGPEEKSVAPALENDPSKKNMPNTLPNTTASAGGAGAGAGDAGAGAGTGSLAGTSLLVTDPNNPAAPQTPAGTQPAPGTFLSSLDATDNPVDPNNPPPAGQLTSMPVQMKLGQLGDPNNPSDSDNPVDPAAASARSNTARSPGCRKILIRKEYSTLTRDEKKAFADAVKCVRTKPSRFRSGPEWNAADDWTLLHIRMVRYVHFTAYFPLFHRAFTAIVERDLNNCGFPLGLPWTDWSKTADDPSTNAIWDSDPEYGLGTNGKGDNKECPWGTGLAVTDGALSDHVFNAPFKHRLCRQFNNMDVNLPNEHFGPNCTTFINANFIKGLGTTHGDGRFFDFSSALEIGTHLSMHTCIGGNLAWLSSSPNDIVFHAIHAWVDNIYDTWQRKSPKNQNAFHGPKAQQKNGAHTAWNAKPTDVINFSPLAENVMAQDLLDHESGKWGGRMCYRYDYNVDM